MSQSTPIHGSVQSQPPQRREILTVASELFGYRGYRNTSWSDVAPRVYLSETAIHHYFESKQQCLYEVMADGILAGQRAFDLHTAGVDFNIGFERVFRQAFEKNRFETCRNRVLMVEQPLMIRRRAKPKEEEARQMALEQMLTLERSWIDYLKTAMIDGWIPKADPQLLWKAIFGLYDSIWLWYRLDGDLTLEMIGDRFLPQFMTMAGVSSARG